MGLFDKFKKIINKSEEQEVMESMNFIGDVDSAISKLEKDELEVNQTEEYMPPVLEDAVLATFDDDVIDTSSPANIDKLKHNLQILIAEAKEKGKIENFVTIREDNFLPIDWEWRVLSDQTNLEPVFTYFSQDLRKAYLLQQQGREPFKPWFGNQVMINASTDELNYLLSNSDKTITFPLLPSNFRSTKHFTVNTPLGYTHSYNWVDPNRDFIIIDNINSFLASDYAYSVAYYDAYADVTHESLPISDDAVVLINDEKYERIISNPENAEALSKRKVIRFKGDESLAICMLLTQIGVLPSAVEGLYITYDQELQKIIDSSIVNLAAENDLYHFKSHGGKEGHFSCYYDDKNHDQERAKREFLEYICNKFPEYSEFFPKTLRLYDGIYYDYIAKVGVDKLYQAVQEYNEMVKARMAKRLEKYKTDRASISPETRQLFVETVQLINEFYKENSRYQPYDFEDIVQLFFQAPTVAAQVEAAHKIKQLIQELNIVKKNKTEILPTEAVRYALEGIHVDRIAEMDGALHSKTIQKENEGVIINGQ